MLRVAERAAHVGHVPDVLYAWRMVPGSTRCRRLQLLAQDAGRRAVGCAQPRGVKARLPSVRAPLTTFLAMRS